MSESLATHGALRIHVMASPDLPAASRRYDAGIFLLSLGTLLLELSLTRVMSVALWYHFGFLVISMALLGFGTSGVVLALWRGLRERADLDAALSLLSILFGAVTIGSFALMQRIPFEPFNLAGDRRQFVLMPLYFVVVAAPFFCSGLALALLFTRRTRDIGRLYAYDLLGAGIGCASIALVMPRFGGSGSVVTAAAVGLLAATAFGWRGARGLATAGLLLAAGAIGLAFVADRALPIVITRGKFKLDTPPLFEKWNTFSRIDLLEYPEGSKFAPDGWRGFLFDAGTALTGMSDLRPDVRTALRALSLRQRFDSQVAYLDKAHPRLLIIGSGAGAEVLDGVQRGAQSVTAVEVNPIITATFSGPLRDYWGGLFEQPGVRLVTDEGRSFVRRSRNRYDAIVSMHTISNAAVASGALSLVENYVLTREAFEDDLDHLADDGVILFSRPEAQIARLFATGREALEARGADHVPAHFYAVKPAKSDFAGRGSFYALFLMKKSPFTDAEVRAMNRFMAVGVSPAHAEDDSMVALYSPLEPTGNSIYQRLLDAPDPRTVYAAEAAELRPATDDRPFFNQHMRWSRMSWSVVRDLFSQGKGARMALEERPIAEVTLLVVLAQAALVAGLLILLPLARLGRGDHGSTGRGRILVYFAALGLGFIFVEVVLLQHFTLFLGEPVYTFAVVLAGLLASTSVGARWTGQIVGTASARLGRIMPGLLATLFMTALLVPLVFHAALGLALPLRIAISLGLVAPTGVALGMPFPTGLRIVSEEAPGLVPWAWGINGFFTVIGTILALMLAMMFGFTTVLALAGGCYVAAWLALGFGARAAERA